MSTHKYLDKTGLGQVWAKIKALITQSNWNENDTTKKEYIQNRTHYISGQSNALEIDFSGFLKDTFRIGTTTYPHTQGNYTYDMSISCYVEFGDNASYDNELVYFDYTVPSMQMILNGTTYSLLFDAEDVDEKWPYGYLYNEHICIGLDWHYMDDDSIKYCGFGYVYFNDDYLKVGDELKLIVPLTQPINTYNKLNSNYLDGKLICRGAGEYSEVFNYTSKNIATGAGSHAEGWDTIASGNYSHAEGNGTIASGIDSHAEGDDTIASGYCSHAEGSGYQLFVYRFNCEAGSNILNIVTPPNLPSYITFTDLINLHAKTLSDYFIKEFVIENGELKSIILNEPYPYERNNYNDYLSIQQIAGATSSHIEGSNNIINTNGNDSHVEGNSNYTNGNYSHVEGSNNVCLTSRQHVQGKYNEIDTQNKYAHIVGNGTYNARSNAHTLDWSGNGWYAGKLTVGAAPTDNMDVATKSYVDNHVPDLSAYVTVESFETRVIPIINNILSQYGDGDTASYGFLDGNEVSY